MRHFGVLILALGVGCGGDDGSESTFGEAGGTGGSGGPTTTTTTGTSEASSEGSSGGTTTTAATGSESSGTTAAQTGSSGDTSGSGGCESSTGDETTGTTGEVVKDHPLWVTPNLWYSVEDQLHYIVIDESDGSVSDLVSSTITTPMIDGQNGITMLEQGSLLLSRESDGATEIYYVEDPPMVAGEIEVEVLGVVPDALRIEALYTDCQGLVYLMDTGSDVSSATGNRLIRFSGDYLAGDLSYEVITDLQMASAPDIDDLGPGIDAEGEITDGQGFAIDTSTVYNFDYNTGTGVVLGNGGTWGTHALGGPLFDDGTARLYLLNSDAELYEASPVDLALSEALVTGPLPTGDAQPGWSGIAGPLTECETTLPEPG